MTSSLIHPAAALLDTAPFPEKGLEQFHDGTILFIRDRHGFCRVQLGTIHCVHADGNYVELDCGKRRFVLRTSLKAMLDQLGQAFMQVNRSTAVNMHRLDRVDYDTVSVEGRIHSLGRNFRSELLEAITVLG